MAATYYGFSRQCLQNADDPMEFFPGMQRSMWRFVADDVLDLYRRVLPGNTKAWDVIKHSKVQSLDQPR